MDDALTKALWRSRNTIFEVLEDRGYNPSEKYLKMEYVDFCEWHKNTQQGQVIMDDHTMILSKRIGRTEHVIYVFWITEISSPNLGKITSIVQSTEYPENPKIKKRNINVIVVSYNDSKHPSKDFIAKIHELGLQHFTVYTINELQYNISKHKYVPKHRVVPKKEAKVILGDYSLQKKSMPKLLSTDPMVRHIGAIPGDVVEIDRPIVTQPGYFELVYKIVS